MVLRMELNSRGRPLALPENIRLAWKCVRLANILAYYNMSTITAVIDSIVKALVVVFTGQMDTRACGH